MNNVDITDFVKFTAAGLRTASFPEVKATVISRYKAAYGNDIDAADTTADGVFINNISLMITNILSGMQTLYSNLDVDTAAGKYLDSLCKLSNVKRIMATHSKASITISPVVAHATVSLDTGTKFVDKAAVTWTYHGPAITFDAETQIEVECDEDGDISAPEGWIYQTLELSAIVVNQTEDAVIGLKTETDTALRMRRDRSIGSKGLTVLQSVESKLLSIDGIEDVEIYNNDSTTARTASDGTPIPAHNIYVVVRKRAGVEVPNADIGTIIYETLTPGVCTTSMSLSTGAVGSGTGKSYVYIETVLGLTGASQIRTIYWKEATPRHPSFTVTISKLANFSSETYNKIGNAVIEYMNSLRLNSVPASSEIIVAASNVGDYFQGRPTFVVTSVSLANLAPNYDTYYKYTTFTYNDSTGVISFS